MALTLPCATALRTMLSYDVKTGGLFWRVARRGMRDGDTAGHFHKASGYIRLGFGGQLYLAHRIAWKLHTGDEPPEVLDHVDGDRTNNRWANLRAATVTLNNCNRVIQKNNKSGVKGVYQSRHGGWVAVVTLGGKKTYLGYFKNKSDAVSSVDAARPLLHGEFARAA